MREYRKQESPYAAQIEFVEGCNLRCGFCGLQGIRSKEDQGKNYKSMSKETLTSVMTGMVDAGWNPRIEFAMHGEPTMHEDYIGMIRLARELAPRLQLMMTSNGGGLLQKPGPVENISRSFEAGLNILALDDYQGIGYVSKIRKALETGYDFSYPVYDYPADPRGNPHHRHPVSYRMLSLVQDISITEKGTHGKFKFNNHTGCGAPPLKEPLQSRCANPFREIAFRWDGSIALCCNDWRGYYKCGNINDTLLEDIWNGPAFGAAREVLILGNRRDIDVCSRCDYHTYRNGLLPDKYGKERLDLPDDQTFADIEKACAGDPYTKPVLNPWELT